MKNYQINIKTEALEMRKKLLTALTGVTLCLAFATNPNPTYVKNLSPSTLPAVKYINTPTPAHNHQGIFAIFVFFFVGLYVPLAVLDF